MGAPDLSAIHLALESRDYDAVIDGVRSALSDDAVATMADPLVARWIGRRYRALFLDEATVSPEALDHSQRPLPLRLVDRRDDRERVAQRMFKHIDPAEIHDDLPPARPAGFGGATLLFAPGLITGYMPSLAFQSVFPRLVERFDASILSSDSHPVRSSEANAADLSAAMEHGIGNAPDPEGTLLTAEDDPPVPRDVILMGYSKGTPDIWSFLVARPDLAQRVRAVVCWAGASGGSYLANDMFAKVSRIPDSELAANLAQHVGDLLRRFLPFPDVRRIDRRLDEYDVKGALQSLTTDYREAWNAEHAATLQGYGIPVLYVTGATTPHEVAYMNLQGKLELDRYDPDNDMQLTQAEATPPMDHAVHIAEFHANHWDLSYDTWPWYKAAGSHELREPFTRYCAASALLLLLSELGLLS